MITRLTVLFFILAITACSDTHDAVPPVDRTGDRSPVSPEGPPLVLSIVPVERAVELYERFLPLKYYLEGALRRPVAIKISKDYETAMQEIGRGEVHLAYLDPGTYCEVRARYKGKVFPLAKVVGAGAARSRSVLIVKEGSGIERAADLKGKRIALGNPQSSFSYLIPLALLQDVGLNVRDFSSVDFLQQEDRVVLSVLVGNHDAGGISEAVARKYLGDGLRIIQTSETIPQFVICASETLGEEIRRQVGKALTEQQGGRGDSPGQGQTERFAAAEDRDFDVIRVMLRNLTGKDYIEYAPGTVRVAVLPLYSALTIYERYDPLMRYLSEQTGRQVKLVIPRTFEEFIEVVKSGRADFSYQNPFIFAILSREMNIRPLVTTIGEDCSGEEAICGEDRFRGVILTRQDSGITTVRDLKNRRVMVVSPKSAGGYLSQKIYLREYGIDADRDLRIIDAKKQERVILGVYRGEADAGFVRESAPVVWKNVVDASKLRILARTTYLPNWPLAVCNADRAGLAPRVRKLLTELTDEAILRSARIKGFRVARDSDYEALTHY